MGRGSAPAGAARSRTLGCSGAPPSGNRTGREELADGEPGNGLTKSAARSSKTPDGALESAAPRQRRRMKEMWRRPALHPPHFGEGFGRNKARA